MERITSNLVGIMGFVGIGTLIVVIISWWTWRGHRMTGYNQLPGPMAFPLFGSLPSILWTLWRNPLQLSSFQLLTDLRIHYGSGIIGLVLGPHRFVILDELPLIKKVLSSEDWANRIKDDEIFKERTFGRDYGLLTSNGDSWREMRRFVAKTLVRFGFGRGTSLQLRHETEILEFFQHIERKYPKICDNSSGDVVGMQGLFNIASLNILWTMVTSSKFSYDSDKILELTILLERMTRDIHPKEMGFLAFPWLRFIPNATAYSRFMQDGKDLQQYFKSVLTERRELGLYKTEQSNFVDAFLAKIDHTNDDCFNNKVLLDGINSTIFSNNPYYTDEQLISVLVDLFATGFLPIASCLEYLIMFMVLHPYVQARCREEVDNVLGGGSPNDFMNHTESMPYVSATIAETLRKVTFIPLTSRAATKDTWVDKYFVQKDTVALINLYHVHHNPEEWKDPESFVPDRFLDVDGNLVNQDSILPFGTGKRVCPAEVFGRLTIFTFFVSLLQRYEFGHDTENPLPDPTPNVGMGNYPKPFRAIFKLRK